MSAQIALDQVYHSLRNEKWTDIKNHQLISASYFYQFFERKKEKAAREERVASYLIKNLDDRATDSQTVIKTAKLFKKIIGRPNEALEKAITARQLKISVALMDKNPGFYEYCTQEPLHRYLNHYQHRLKTNGEDIFIPFNGKHTKWRKIPKEAYTPLRSGKENLPNRISLYGPMGIQSKDRYEWNELPLYKKFDQPPPWGERYLFELCVCCTSERYRFEGDHTFMRLYTKTGEVYSVGIYRQGKNVRTDRFSSPFKLKQGYLQSPDVSEAWPIPIHSVGFAVSEEKFNEIKESIEQDRKEKLPFGTLETNCTKYACSKLAMLGVTLDPSIMIWRLIFPEKLVKVIDRTASYLPGIINRITSIFGAIVINTLIVILGGSCVSKSIRGKIEQLPKIRSFFDIFRPSRSYINAPTYLAQDIFPKIEAYVTDPSILVKNPQLPPAKEKEGKGAE